MATKGGRKRAANSQPTASKRRKISTDKARPAAKPKDKGKGKERAFEKSTIPIPVGDDEDAELDEDDLALLDEYGGAVNFLGSIDKEGIARSKKETARLHALTKPVRQSRRDDDLPSVASHSDDERSWDSGLEDELPLSEDEDDSISHFSEDDLDSDDEMPYETAPRIWRATTKSEPKNIVDRLPIKLSDGRVQKSGTRVIAAEKDSDDAESSDEGPPVLTETYLREDVSTGARFGRLAVVDVIAQKSRKARIQGAKEQIAGICQEILADPENSLGLLRRLNTFSLPEISSVSHPDPVPNDIVIRKLAFISQAAVFKDVIPGYRIRPLTEKEKAEKVSQMVARTRDWEQGLVGVYQTYLRTLDAEIRAKSELAEIALQSMCTLLVEVTQFNFRVNLLSSIVAKLSRKSWDKSSDLCLSSLIRVFKSDATGEASLDAVRLINRMVKERGFSVHPNALRCLLHLRLKQELGVRSSLSKADKPDTGKTHSAGRSAARRAKGKPADKPHLSKKAAQALKEKKEIEKEMHEASAEVDKEERANHQTETLKLLFVLYFRILKNPRPTPLLPAALQGISRYAHLVNVDFFKDLMNVLKHLIDLDLVLDTAEPSQDAPSAPAASGGSLSAVPGGGQDALEQHRLRCIITAFELLSGQGEALNIDLTDFINALYAIVPVLDMTVAAPDTSRPGALERRQSTPDLLFRVLDLIFSPRRTGAAHPSWRSAAFAKRLLTCALAWPGPVVLRALDFVGGLIAKDAKLEALLATDDRAVDGVYRADIDDPQLCNPFGTSLWELQHLRERHYDPAVRLAAAKLADYTR